MMKLIPKLFIVVAIFIGTTAWADWQTQEENWYGVTIDGDKSGWAKEVVAVEDDLIRTSKTQEMTLSRGGIVISIKIATEFIETSDGKPVSVKSTQEAMGQTSETTWVFKKDNIEMTSVAGGTPILKAIDLPDTNWLTPQGVRSLFVSKLKDGVDEITYQTMSPELGPKVVTILMKKLGEENRDVLGETVPVTIWETSNSIMPMVGTDTYTIDGIGVESRMDAGIGVFRSTIMSQHEAMSPLNEIPELMVSLFVEPNVPIQNGASQKTLTLNVKTKDGSKLSLPTTGAQHAINQDDGSVVLSINLEDPAAATEAELNDKEYLAASALCDGTDEVVAAIAVEAMQNLTADATDLDKALALRSKVFTFISDKNMSTAFASASQTARDKKGDCSEHGVLLCGLLRSVGIPSRGVMGMVYVPDVYAENGVFGWHMWSQALIDGKWIDLDATLQLPYTVGHIATTMTSLSDDTFAAEMGSLITTIGNLEVEVVTDDTNSP
jgi:hypothetical protein